MKIIKKLKFFAGILIYIFNIYNRVYTEYMIVNLNNKGEKNMAFQKIGKNKLLREKIYDMLKEAIVSGELKPGERIIESKLAKDIGISRTPIREAIRLLESEGYLESMDSGGVRIVEITEEDIKDWSEIKSVLNELAVIKAIDNITDQEIKELEKDLEEVEKTINNSNNGTDEIIERNTDFHQRIFAASGNDLIKNISYEYQKYTYIMRNCLSQIEGRKKQALKEHKKILKAIKKRNKEKAIKLSKEHSESSKKALLKKIRKEE